MQDILHKKWLIFSGTLDTTGKKQSLYKNSRSHTICLFQENMNDYADSLRLICYRNTLYNWQKSRSDTSILQTNGKVNAKLS